MMCVTARDVELTERELVPKLSNIMPWQQTAA